jgi:hypothetical protein
MQIVDFYYLIARENLRINSFTYGKAYRKGSGTDRYPLLWLDDPIYGQTLALNQFNALSWTVNVDILGIPSNEDDVMAVQAAAFLVGIGIPERAKVIYKTTGVAITGYKFISLRDYYDDKAAGYRFTYTLSIANPVDLCANDYNPDKVFSVPSPLPAFIVDNPQGCATFAGRTGLPDFSVAPDE